MNYFTVAVTLRGGRVLTRTVQYDKSVPEGVAMHELRVLAKHRHCKHIIKVDVYLLNGIGK